MVSQVFYSTQCGFDSVGLRTAALELELVPSLGGRIVSLRSLRSRREWCWRRPEPEWLWPSEPSSHFGDSPQAGIDECLPTVAACEVDARQLPDHGELWYRRWELEKADLAAGRLTSQLTLEQLPLEFERTISATSSNCLRFDYRLRNQGERAEHYLWSAHPLLALAPGDRLTLPTSVRELRLNGGLAERFGEMETLDAGSVWTYPEPLPGIRLDRLQTLGDPGCVKGFAGPLSGSVQAALWNEGSGDRLELRWNALENPFLGIWLNRGCFGIHHLGIEPTNGVSDSLAEALRLSPDALTLEPGASRSWSMEWHLS